jgi:hypothetical protein
MSVLLDFKKLQELAMPYIKEYFDSPKEELDVSNTQIELISNIVSGIIINNTQDYIFSKIKDKQTASENTGESCLRKSKTLPKKTNIGSSYDNNYRDGKNIIMLRKVYGITKETVSEFENTKSITMEASKLGIAPKISDMYTCCSPEYGCYSICYLDVPKNAMNIREFYEKKSTTKEMKKKVQDMLKASLKKLESHGILFKSIWDINAIIVKNKDKIKIYFLNYRSAVRTENMKNDLYTRSVDDIKFVFYDKNPSEISVEKYVVARMIEDKVLNIEI